MNWFKAGAAFMLVAVALGAFGAHALKDRLNPYEHEVWRAAARYHALHALALMIPGTARAGWLFSAGIVLFSGSLYALALTGTSRLGAITPIGGALFLAGWARLLLAR